jgi:protein-disulfide isomerase
MLSKPVVLLTLPILTAGSATILATTIKPYWIHYAWTELPELPTGVDANGHHWMGAEDPLVTIVEYSDYECPFCRRAHKEMRLKAAKFPETVRLVHRHYPLDQACNEEIKREFHHRACELSKAVECAAHQEAFWKMNDALFSIQESIKTEDVDLEGIAVSLGLDRSHFKACLEAPGMPKQVTKEMESAQKLRIKGTPTFFVGPQEFAGGVPDLVIQKAVERAKKEKLRSQ